MIFTTFFVQSLRRHRYIKVGSGLHLELVHSGTSLGDVELVVVLAGHNRYSFFIYCFVVVFGYRKHSLAEKEVNMRFSVCQFQANCLNHCGRPIQSMYRFKTHPLNNS